MFNSTSEININSVNSTQIPSVSISPDNNSNPTNAKNRGNYVKSACRPCALAKVKCSGDMPCDRCSKHVKDCLYEPQRKRGPKIRRSRSTSCDNRYKQQQDDLGSVPLRRTRSNCDRRRSSSPFETTKAENNNALYISFPNTSSFLTQNDKLHPNHYIEGNQSLQPGFNYPDPALLTPSGVFNHSIVDMCFTPPQPEIIQNNCQSDFPHSPQSDEWQFNLVPEFENYAYYID
ncbi:3569_t:CDS:1 [Racocetra fulgida]|uniref:3569_t:CDS:1 n=1 Tax=Racocetra fulgida TaxID=60492 RepID=A0A9N9GTX0_9GLOM|nr:3569_t:CDS:1 [Racocetra fulgida]